VFFQARFISIFGYQYTSNCVTFTVSGNRFCQTTVQVPAMTSAHQTKSLFINQVSITQSQFVLVVQLCFIHLSTQSNFKNCTVQIQPLHVIIFVVELIEQLAAKGALVSLSTNHLNNVLSFLLPLIKYSSCKSVHQVKATGPSHKYSSSSSNLISQFQSSSQGVHQSLS
jgi:hypothetical protein